MSKFDFWSYMGRKNSTFSTLSVMSRFRKDVGFLSFSEAPPKALVRSSGIIVCLLRTALAVPLQSTSLVLLVRYNLSDTCVADQYNTNRLVCSYSAFR